MSWVKLDDQFFFNRKIIKAGRDARDLYLASLAYCAGQLTDGFVPAEALPLLHVMAGIANDKQIASKLLSTGLWEASDNGYIVHDYLKYNPTKEQVEITREARAEAGSRGGRAKYSKMPSKRLAKGKQNGSKTEAKVCPLPVPLYPEASGEKTATRALPGARQEQNAKRAELEQHFAMASGLPVLKCETTKQKRSAGELWWGPLREILELQGWDDYRSKNLIDLALARMREARLTVSSPKSILNVARAIFAEGAQERIIIEHT